MVHRRYREFEQCGVVLSVELAIRTWSYMIARFCPLRIYRTRVGSKVFREYQDHALKICATTSNLQERVGVAEQINLITPQCSPSVGT